MHEGLTRARTHARCRPGAQLWSALCTLYAVASEQRMATHAEAETVERAAAAGAEKSVRVKALCCSNCNNVAATANEVFTEPAPFHEGYVWSHELDLLDVNTAV